MIHNFQVFFVLCDNKCKKSLSLHRKNKKNVIRALSESKKVTTEVL